MINNKILPAHILIGYTWEVLSLNTSLSKVNGLVPISAIEDEPKLYDSGKTYLVYGWAENESPSQTEIKRGVINLRVMSKSIGETGQVLNVLNRAFENEDRTAENINIWSSTRPEFHGIRFTSVCTAYIESIEPAESEGGKVIGNIAISYNYITNLAVSLPISQGLWR